MKTEFVFDLDDTLYAERDYARSALSFAAGLFEQKFGITDALAPLWARFEGGAADPLGDVLGAYSLPIEAKAVIKKNMQAHIPEISLRNEAKTVLDALRSSGRGFSIVTDGRSVTQRAKIQALGCTDAKLISISEEVGIPKTDVRRFTAIEMELAAQSYCYVGDNPSKDFVAPNELGWHTVMLLDSGVNIHKHGLHLDKIYLAKQSVKSLLELELDA
jgi:putative hydrolase of the HAD superfamily